MLVFCVFSFLWDWGTGYKDKLESCVEEIYELDDTHLARSVMRNEILSVVCVFDL
jgi:hypothetical protein